MLLDAPALDWLGEWHASCFACAQGFTVGMTQTNEEAPRAGNAKRHTVAGAGGIVVAILIAGAALALMGMGQFYAVLVLPLALVIGWWSRRRIAANAREIRRSATGVSDSSSQG